LVSRNQGYGGTVGKMLEDMPPTRGIHFAFVLRNAKKPWTLDQRKQCFQFLIDAAKKPGGASYGNFLNQFRDDAIATCSDAEKVVLDDLINRSLTAPPFESTPPTGPGRKWTTAEAVAELGEKLTKRDHAAGRNLYHATSCAKCHRIGGEGGAIGPDLSTAGKKFSMTDMMDAIVLPSKAISDQYGSQQVLTSDGKSLVGRVVEIDNKVHVYTIDANAKPIVLAKEDVEQMTVSKVSQMPEGLIDTLSSEELKDLMAYIMAAGDKRNAVYR
jgi:putative heme-binding domain-containing protein